MLKMTILSHCLFMGAQRHPGEVVDPVELDAAIKSGKITMVAVNAMKNRGHAMLQDEQETRPAGLDPEILAILGQLLESSARQERNIALLGKAHGVELEAPPPVPAKETVKPATKRGKKAAA
jgi:hypothetical protein